MSPFPSIGSPKPLTTRPSKPSPTLQEDSEWISRTKHPAFIPSRKWTGMRTIFCPSKPITSASIDRCFPSISISHCAPISADIPDASIVIPTTLVTLPNRSLATGNKSPDRFCNSLTNVSDALTFNVLSRLFFHRLFLAGNPILRAPGSRFFLCITHNLINYLLNPIFFHAFYYRVAHNSAGAATS